MLAASRLSLLSAPALAPVADDPYLDANSIPSKFRRKRFERVLGLMDRIIAKNGHCRILDIGGTEIYWNLVAKEIAKPGIAITLCNLSAPAINNTDRFSAIAGDATDLSAHPDMSFDFVHSNSVIEHVGGWAAMSKMAANVRRLAPCYYVQTPYFWFPIEPHFRSVGFHWLPEQMRYRRVMARANGFRDRQDTVAAAMAEVQSCVLLDKGQMRALFPDASLEDERVFGLTKSLMAVRQTKP
jgi:Methyltransferase domain